jgi:hypothetical protein
LVFGFLAGLGGGIIFIWVSRAAARYGYAGQWVFTDVSKKVPAGAKPKAPGFKWSLRSLECGFGRPKWEPVECSVIRISRGFFASDAIEEPTPFVC